MLGSAVYIRSESAPVKAALIVGLSLAGVVAVALGIRLYRPAERFVWPGVGGKPLFWTIAWTLWQSRILTTGTTPPTDSPVNVVFQIGYPLGVLGLLHLSRKREPGVIAFIDAAMVGVVGLSAGSVGGRGLAAVSGFPRGGGAASENEVPGRFHIIGATLVSPRSPGSHRSWRSFDLQRAQVHARGGTGRAVGSATGTSSSGGSPMTREAPPRHSGRWEVRSESSRLRRIGRGSD